VADRRDAGRRRRPVVQLHTHGAQANTSWRNRSGRMCTALVGALTAVMGHLDGSERAEGQVAAAEPGVEGDLVHVVLHTAEHAS
jgi:hypothetical protein